MKKATPLSTLFAALLTSAVLTGSAWAGTLPAASPAAPSPQQTVLAEVGRTFHGEVLQNQAAVLAEMSGKPLDVVQNELAHRPLVQLIRNYELNPRNVATRFQARMIETVMKGLQDRRVSKAEAEAMYTALQQAQAQSPYGLLLKLI